MQKIKKLIILILIPCACFTFRACAFKYNRFSEEEHIQRIAERIEKRFIADQTFYTNFCVYPLFSENEELKYFLVEFEPYGFVFIKLKDEKFQITSCLGTSSSMYGLSNIYGKTTWSPYTIVKTNSQPFPDTDKCWMVDEKGERIFYNKSPYHVTENLEERKYIISLENAEFICAIKSGNSFKNLISLEDFNVYEGDLTNTQATIYIAFIANNRFEL